MREIDDAAEVEDKRKAERHQRVEGADDQPVEDIEQDELRHLARQPAADFFRGRAVCAPSHLSSPRAQSGRPGQRAAGLLDRIGDLGPVESLGDVEQIVRRRAHGRA